jgi:hypothetical protein
MTPRDSGFWAEARQAQDELVRQFLGNPDVTLIDIGHVGEENNTSEQIALRIHVRESWFKAKPEERIAFPDQVSGIPVVVIRGEYQVGQ